jgi:hypothetical protein
MERDNSYEPLRDVHHRLAHEIIQQVIGECPYVGATRDDEVWWNLHELEDRNALPDGYEADDLYNIYRTNYGGQ